MTRFFTDEEMQKLQNMDKNILKKSYNNLNENQKQVFGNTYKNTFNKQKFWGFEWKQLQGVEWYNENQIWIPWVNLLAKNNQNQVTQNTIETPKIQGMDAVKFRDEPTWNLDLTYTNFQNIYKKQARGEKLGIAEQNFLTDLKLKNKFEWKSMQEIFGIETKQDKERKYQNLAIENRNLNAWDLRNSLVSKGLNYDEIEKVIGYHQPYNEYLTTQNELKSRSDEVFAKKKELLDKQLLETTNQIKENWKNRMNVLNSWLSFSGFGRSSYALERRDEVTRSINAEISIAQAKAQAELKLYQAQLQGADTETLGALSQNLKTYTNALQNQQTENAKLAQALNDEANISLTQALDNMIALSWVNPEEVDVERSKLLWFAADKYWNAILKDENWNAIMIRSVIENDRDFWLERDKFDYGKNKDVLDYELKNIEKEWKIRENFIKWNQDLFDDIRADTKDFSELTRQYSIMKNAWDAYQKGDKSNKGTVEQQLITVFNKMMDPGSVVREWEFDRTSQGQSIIARFTEQINRLNQWWAWISDKVLKDLVDWAELMFNSWKQTMLNKKENFKANAYHLWADPSFVDSYFNRELWLYNDKDEENIDKQWENFNKADQTALTKAIPRQVMQIAFSATRKTWQCGAFVNDYVQKITWKRIMWDSYKSKEKNINSNTPQLWGLAVWNPWWGIKEYWHTGIVTWVWEDYVIIKDANWKWDEKVMTRKVKIKDILASRGGWKGWFVNFA